VTQRRLRFGNGLNLELTLGDESTAVPEALIIPQDVNLIMGEVTVLEETGETPGDAVAAAAAITPRAPGSLLVGPRRPGHPLLFQAVVYDFQHSPPVREEHVFEALVTAFEKAGALGVRTLALRPLGTAHGGLAAGRFLGLLAQVCYSASQMGTTLERVLLLLPTEEERGAYRELAENLV
jgi:hypothetical protein